MMRRILFLAGLAVAGVPAVAADQTEVPLAEREAESRRLRELGLSVPAEGVVLARPFARPYSRRSFVVPQAWMAAAPRPETPVSAQDLLRDLGPLADLMKLAYGGWESARARGWDWQVWFDRWRQMLERHGDRKLPVAEAFAPVKELMDVQLDNHTNLPLGLRFGSGSRSVVLEAVPRGRCSEVRTAGGQTFRLHPGDPAQRVRHARRWDAASGRLQPAAYLALPARKGEISAVLCGRRWIGTTAVASAQPGRPRELPSARRLTEQVVHLRLPSFSKEDNEIISAQRASWPRPAGGEHTLIVDLRDNDGGDINLEALAPWIHEGALERAMDFTATRGASCLYTALRWGYVVASTAGVRPPISDGLRSSLQQSLDELQRPAEPGCPRRFERQRGSWGYRQHRFRPAGRALRIMVVVNAGCGSDCELMTQVLASLPQTVVVGANTYGVMQFIQPGYSVLPHTRLPFRIALGTSDGYGDGRSVDGHGLDVDIVLAAAADQSTDSLLRLAQHLEENERATH
jgi:hypothetical protein